MFLYSEQLPAHFHCQAIQELLRVANEVRIFPLATLGGGKSSLLDPVCRNIQATDHSYRIETVDYEFQRGSYEMLRVS